jgi:hypothetical protein
LTHRSLHKGNNQDCSWDSYYTKHLCINNNFQCIWNIYFELNQRKYRWDRLRYILNWFDLKNSCSHIACSPKAYD